MMKLPKRHATPRKGGRLAPICHAVRRHSESSCRGLHRRDGYGPESCLPWMTSVQLGCRWRKLHPRIYTWLSCCTP